MIVIGCDGIKSRVRAWMMGADHPSTPPVYTHKYAYRGLIPMEKAKKELGDDLASNAKMHVSQSFPSLLPNHLVLADYNVER